MKGGLDRMKTQEEQKEIKENIKENIIKDLKASGKFTSEDINRIREVWDDVTDRYVFKRK